MGGPLPAAQRALLMLLVALAVGLCNAFDTSEFIRDCLCDPVASGAIDDCCCDVETVNMINARHVRPVLDDVARAPFFSFWRANLWRDCDFFADKGLCFLPSCSVHECSPDDEPEVRAYAAEVMSAVNSDDARGVTGVEDDNLWTIENEAVPDAEAVFYNLLDNPERFTGYTGELAHRIWRSIYQENCFDVNEEAMDDVCVEKRIFFRLISGLHTSITVHIARDYYDEATGVWGPSLDVYRARVASFPNRIKNLHFAYLFVLRAVIDAAPQLAGRSYAADGSNEAEAAALRQALSRMIRKVDGSLEAHCPQAIDTGVLFTSEAGPELRNEMRQRFRNISRIMDCVTCEKCRLWGKLQIVGMGTALRLALGDKGEDVRLQRSEVVALINLLNNLSNSIYTIDVTMRELEIANRLRSVAVSAGVVVVGAVVFALFVVKTGLKRCRRRSLQPAKKE